MLTAVVTLTLANMALVVIAGVASRSRGLLWLMLFYGIVLSLGGMFSLAASLAHATDGAPYLAGSDGEGYYMQAVLLAQNDFHDIQNLIRSNYIGYQLYLALWFNIFGASLTVGLIANNALLVASVLALYRATVLLARSRRAAFLACLAFILTTTHIYYALLLLKEPALGLGFALILLAAAETLRGHAVGLRALLYFGIGVLIIITMRGTLLVFLLVLMVFVGGPFLRRKSHMIAAFLAVLLIMAPFAQNFTIHDLSLAFVSDTVTENTVIASKFAEGNLDVGGVVGRVSGAYLALSFLPKLLLFFIPGALQFLLPFDFWSLAFLEDHFSNFFSHNLNLLWFLFVGVWALFSVANFRRIDDQALRRFLLAGVFYYSLVAVIYGGAIPRYGAPALFFVYPAIGYFWDQSRSEPVTRYRAQRFFRRYYVILAIAMILYIAFQAFRLH